MVPQRGAREPGVGIAVERPRRPRMVKRVVLVYILEDVDFGLSLRI